jgi:hypothetical protein
MVISSVMAAFGVVLPIAFHSVGMGSEFLPMLLPLLLNGFLSTTLWAALTGALVPPASALLTGMPPLYPPIALVMSVEGALMAATASIFYRMFARRVWPALIAAVLADRIASFAMMWFLAGRFGVPAAAVSVASLVQGLPGVALQLAIVPVAVRALRARKGILFGYDEQSETGVFQ